MKKLFLAVITLPFLYLAQAQTDSLATKDSLDRMIGQMIMVGIGDFNLLDQKADVFDLLPIIGGCIPLELAGEGGVRGSWNAGRQRKRRARPHDVAGLES